MGKNGETPVPVPRARETTARISRDLVAALPAVGVAQPDPDQFLDKFVERVAQKLHGNGNGNGGSGKPPSKFLGIDKGGWTKMVAGWLIAVAMLVGTWWLWVHDELRDRPTRIEIRETMTEALDIHGMVPHKPTAQRLEAVEKEQRTIRESQIRAEEVDLQQTKVLDEILGDVKRLRRRR